MPTTRTPLRYPLKEAAELLRVGVSSLRKLIAEGEFTIISGPRTKGGRGVKFYLRADEVETFGLGGIEALRALRKRGRK